MACERYLSMNVFVRTEGHCFTGRLVEIDPMEIVLEDAAWIPEVGYWTRALRDGEPIEVEPYPDECVISRSSIVDISPWNHPLPRERR